MATDGFDDLVPRWLFPVRPAWARVSLAVVLALVCAIVLAVVDDPGESRPAPVLIGLVILVAALGGWQGTMVGGSMVVALYWWYAVPPMESVALEGGVEVAAVGAMAGLVLGLTALTHRIERSVREVRELDERRRRFAQEQAASRLEAERAATDVARALQLSTELARLHTMAEVADHVLANVGVPEPSSIGSIAVLNRDRLRVVGARNAEPASLRSIEQVDVTSSSWLGEVLGGVPALVDDRDEFARLHPEARTLRLYPSGSWATIPFRSRGTVGLLSLWWFDPQQLTRHATYFSLVAEILANALDRTDAEERQRSQYEELEQAFAERDRIARTLSTTLLPPRLPVLSGFSAAGWVIPGSPDEVAGDFYDLFSVGGGDWFAVLGDVCGKGAEAAAVTSLARYATRVATLDDADPRHVAVTANRALTDDPSDLFCTIVAVRYRGEREEVEVALCGHQQARLLSDRGLERVGTFAPALGLSDRAPDVERRRLARGDAVVLFSDGIIERSKEFDEERLDALLASMAGASAEAIAAVIREKMDALPPERTDDMSLLVIARDRD